MSFNQDAIVGGHDPWMFVHKIELADGVTIYEYGKDDFGTGKMEVRHVCDLEDGWYHGMIRRNDEEGPVYWCSHCGYTTDEGTSMAIRLYEVDI